MFLATSEEEGKVRNSMQLDSTPSQLTSAFLLERTWQNVETYSSRTDESIICLTLKFVEITGLDYVCGQSVKATFSSRKFSICEQRLDVGVSGMSEAALEFEQTRGSKEGTRNR